MVLLQEVRFRKYLCLFGILLLTAWCTVSAIPPIQLTPEYMKASQLFSEGKYDEAVAALQPLMTNPDFAAAAKIEAGMIRKRQAESEYSQAMSHFQEAATNLSDGIMAGGMQGNEAAKTLFELGQLFEERLQDPEKAIKIFTNIMEEHPNFLALDKVLYHLALCHEKLGKVTEAARLYRELVVKFPYSSFFSTAQIKMKTLSPGTSEAQSAIEVQESLVENARTDAQAAKASMDLANLYAKEGDFQKAIQEYRKVAAESPNSDLAKEAYKKMAALLDEKERDYRGAAAAIEEMISRFPNEPGNEVHLYKLGRIYEENLEEKKLRIRDNQKMYKIGDSNIIKAIEYYDKVTETAPDADISADAFLRKGELYETRLKNIEAAKKEYQEFLQRFPNHSKAAAIKEKLKELE